MEHDRPTLLLQLACEKLRIDRIVRPGPARLERLVVAARQEAPHETFRLLAPMLSDDLEEFRGSVARIANEMVRLFGELARLVLDPTVRDAQLRYAIYRRIPAERLQKSSRNPPGLSATSPAI